MRPPSPGHARRVQLSALRPVEGGRVMLHPVETHAQRRILGPTALSMGYVLLRDWGEGTVHLVHRGAHVAGFAVEDGPPKRELPDLIVAYEDTIGKLRLACKAHMDRS